MRLKELINKSIYGTIGYIKDEEDIELLESYIIHNLPVLKEFKQIVVATNYRKIHSDLPLKHHHLWEKYFPYVELLTSAENRGHNFGTADLDDMLFEWCEENNQDWLCKSANDILIQSQLLEQEVDDSDFYYLNGIGYGGMVKYNFDFDEIIKNDFYPQTNFYILNVSKCDYLNDRNYIDETYEIVKGIKDYNGKVWEYIEGWSCEDFLKECVERNRLSKYHLVPQDIYRNLLFNIKTNHIHDCSHKNILINNICHFHNPLQPLLEI